MRRFWYRAGLLIVLALFMPTLIIVRSVIEMRAAARMVWLAVREEWACFRMMWRNAR